jgi:hypothetical protein
VALVSNWDKPVVEIKERTDSLSLDGVIIREDGGRKYRLLQIQRTFYFNERSQIIIWSCYYFLFHTLDRQVIGKRGTQLEEKVP